MDEKPPKQLVLTAIVAMTVERVIGHQGKLPWHLPEDLQFFKATTIGHPVVMGRKTFESIGRPLPKRRNIVLTRDPEWSAEGVEVIHSPSELDQLAALSGQAFVIGGAEIYEAFRSRIDDFLVSHIVGNYAGDTHLPPFEDEFPCVQTIGQYEGFVVKRHARGVSVPPSST